MACFSEFSEIVKGFQTETGWHCCSSVLSFLQRIQSPPVPTTLSKESRPWGLKGQQPHMLHASGRRQVFGRMWWQLFLKFCILNGQLNYKTLSVWGGVWRGLDEVPPPRRKSGENTDQIDLGSIPCFFLATFISLYPHSRWWAFIQIEKDKVERILLLKLCGHTVFPINWGLPLCTTVDPGRSKS